MLELSLVDEIVPEPLGGAHNDWPGITQTLKTVLQSNLAELKKSSAGDRLKSRYQKYRAIGQFLENKAKVVVSESPLENGDPSHNGQIAPLPAPPAPPSL